MAVNGHDKKSKGEMLYTSTFTSCNDLRTWILVFELYLLDKEISALLNYVVVFTLKLLNINQTVFHLLYFTTISDNVGTK